MKKLTLGILAHVDAGKTTLSESLLYSSGTIGKMGRVDNKDAYLDNFPLERARGITIFAKQALLKLEKTEITLLDTPGHLDFSAEMERTLQVLDYALLVINGADGIQGHTLTLWKLLKVYEIPTFIFVNKMDQIASDREKLLNALKKQLDSGCMDFNAPPDYEFYEQMALCDEHLLEQFLEKGHVPEEDVVGAITRRKVYPCFFGSALKIEGVDELLEGLESYTQEKDYPDSFGARIYKISRDEQGNRLTHLKVTGGSLRVKEVLTHEHWSEKINQIRIYSGRKYEAVQEVGPGTICAVTGLSLAKAGDRLGIEGEALKPLLEPVLSYRVILPEGYDPKLMLPKLRLLEEEEPELRILWEEEVQEIHVQIMGEVQLEVLQSQVAARFDVVIGFDEGNIVYKETIANTVEGVGHFEPLRHYAEVHLLLEPLERGSGLIFKSDCNEDLLSKNWQRLVLGHLEERNHRGVLTGSAITDLKITLVSGKAHQKHTSGGDFREATYRAVRQGLKEAESILLEPYYEFQLTLPSSMVGRAMMDIERMYGVSELKNSNEEEAFLVGNAPVVTMRNYQRELTAYTRGAGRLTTQVKGYNRCHNASDVIERMGYDSERDWANPTGSVFCAQGSGFLVEWYQVKSYMHLESYFQAPTSAMGTPALHQLQKADRSISPEEIDRILNHTYYANQGTKSIWKKRKTAQESYYEGRVSVVKPRELKEEYLLVDGYNIIHDWDELKAMAKEDMESARIRLLHALSNYQGIRKCKIIVVFDAYRVQGHQEEIIDYQNLKIVYTKEAQTADQYIERFAHDHQNKYSITVATSDHLEQMIIRGSGSDLLSARELKIEIQRSIKTAFQAYEDRKSIKSNQIEDLISQNIRDQIIAIRVSKDANNME